VPLPDNTPAALRPFCLLPFTFWFVWTRIALRVRPITDAVPLLALHHQRCGLFTTPVETQPPPYLFPFYCLFCLYGPTTCHYLATSYAALYDTFPPVQFQHAQPVDGCGWDLLPAFNLLLTLVVLHMCIGTIKTFLYSLLASISRQLYCSVILTSFFFACLILTTQQYTFLIQDILWTS